MPEFNHPYVGLARTIHLRCIYGIFGRKFTNIRSDTVFIYISGQPYPNDTGLRLLCLSLSSSTQSQQTHTHMYTQSQSQSQHFVQVA
jgi:hypothetical protein